MSTRRLSCIAVLIVTLLGRPAVADCLRVARIDPAVHVDPVALAAMSAASLNETALYSVMRIVAQYETNGCWSGSTGNFDGQWLSVGVMQWNLGHGSLQLLLARFREKLSLRDLFVEERDRLMPNYGRQLFTPACRAIPVAQRCQDFLRRHYVGPENQLSPDLKVEVDRLFESDTMRQIQVDYFARSLTTVLDDLNRVFQKRAPAAWQVAWAMDLKTQQDRFPTDTSIKRIRALLKEQVERRNRLVGIIKWYEGLCQSGDAEGVRYDCDYNVSMWTHSVNADLITYDREEAVLFTFLVSRTARNQDGLYQADAFQRRATIAFGKGSIHGTRLDFSN